MTTKRVTQCRSCGGDLSVSLVDLGSTPLANSYLESAADALDEPKYPLHARVCERCLLVQLDYSVPPAVMFKEYAYFSSFSESWLAHSQKFGEWATDEFGLSSASSVVEIASNDGYLLKVFIGMGIPVLGIEPAENVAKVALADGVPTEIAFFGTEVAEELVRDGRSADLVVANNVLAHVPELNDFVAGLALLLKADGIASLEFPHLLRLLEEVQFDTIYHEHVFYFSLYAIERLFESHGLEIFDVHELSTHGGSLRVLAAHEGTRTPREGLARVRQLETDAGMDRMSTYEGFAAKVDHCKHSLNAFLAEARARGEVVVAYGAAAKGNTLLNYCRLSTDAIPYVLDRSPHKQGRLLPGSHIPIHAPDTVGDMKPDYLLILPWNLKDEIIDQMDFVRQWGCRFVTPVPEVRVIS